MFESWIWKSKHWDEITHIYITCLKIVSRDPGGVIVSYVDLYKYTGITVPKNCRIMSCYMHISLSHSFLVCRLKNSLNHTKENLVCLLFCPKSCNFCCWGKNVCRKRKLDMTQNACYILPQSNNRSFQVNKISPLDIRS